MKCTACSKTFPMLYASSEGGLCYTCMQNHLVATAASPGPTTTPVEKREEDVATALLAECAEWLEGDSSDRANELFRKVQAYLAEPQPISNPLVCGRGQGTVQELVTIWRNRADAVDEKSVGNDQCFWTANTLRDCADELAALLEGKS